MSKSKRNKKRRDQRVAQSALDRFLTLDPNRGDDRPTLDEANTEVRKAERRLLYARQLAAGAAEAARNAESRRRARMGDDAGRFRAKRVHTPIDLDDAGNRSPDDQADAFFNRPGDYFLAKFAITRPAISSPGHIEIAKAETVLKASEDQFDYLLEVLRQIRGGFGNKCRIELYRTHTVEQASPSPTEEIVRGPARRIAPGSFTIQDGQPIPMDEFTLGPRQRGPEVVGTDGQTDTERAGQIPPWMSGTPLGLPDDALAGRDLTREELQATLPGMTRAEAAAELGKRPEDIGGNVYAADLTREQIAADLGVPVDSVDPIPMTGGGYAYAIKPSAPPPAGRHATPDKALERLDRVEENLDAIRAGVERLVELEEANRGSGP